PAGPPVDVADQLRKLASLRDEGILSDEEFAAQKARLLGG
ncbi:MAG: SHOCT domain-containing protein, partial [Acidimicrobiia bacterium]|nr:SHOCT domain-containing protein [Acidimicrobiia bacterium]